MHFIISFAHIVKQVAIGARLPLEKNSPCGGSFLHMRVLFFFFMGFYHSGGDLFSSYVEPLLGLLPPPPFTKMSAGVHECLIRCYIVVTNMSLWKNMREIARFKRLLLHVH